jgi:hypothetical protein
MITLRAAYNSGLMQAGTSNLREMHILVPGTNTILFVGSAIK